jgi:cytochrome c biogenesis protein CcdA
MKRIRQIILILVLGLLINPFFQSVSAVDNVNIYFFHSTTCLNCADMEEYLIDLQEEYPNTNIIYYEIDNSDNYDLFVEVADAFDIGALAPTVIIGGLAFQGYNDQLEKDIKDTLNLYATTEYVDIVNKIINGETVLDTDFDELIRRTVNLPFIGEVEVESLSLFVGAVILGFVDGFNPCAMWVLVFLIGMLVNLKDRKRMWIIGMTFLFTSALAYFIIMFAYLELTKNLLDTAIWFRYLIGIFAVVFGGYNIHKYFKNRKKEIGCDVTDEVQRKKIIEKIKDIVKKQNLLLALIGVVILAITVNLIELACSAGLPLLFTQILSYNDLSRGLELSYMGIYILFFLIDDLIIFAIAMFTMKVTGISNKYSKLSSIIGGVIMVIIGFLLVFFPNIIMFNF